MRPFLLCCVIVATVVSGGVIGPRLVSDAAAQGDVGPAAPSAAEVRALAVEACQEWLDDNDSSEQAKPSAEEDEALYALLQDRGDERESLDASLTRITHAVELAEKIANRPYDPADKAIQAITAKMLTPLRIGQALLGSRDPEVRTRGVQSIARAAQDGDRAAFDALEKLLADPDSAVARAALNAVRDIAGRDGDHKLEIEASGITARLVAMFPVAEDRAKRTLADLLTDLEHPAAVPYWRDQFNKPEDTGRSPFGGRGRVDAALALKKLGSPSEAQILHTEGAGLLMSAQADDVRRAAQQLANLGTDEAKKLIEEAIARDPAGPNAQTLTRTLRRFGGDRRGGMNGLLEGFGRGR